MQKNTKKERKTKREATGIWRRRWAGRRMAAGVTDNKENGSQHKREKREKEKSRLTT